MHSPPRALYIDNLIKIYYNNYICNRNGKTIPGIPPQESERITHMFRSMTAYSRKCAETDGRSVSVEIKSVNNKYLDLNIRMPRAIVTLEPRIRSLFSEAGVSRGKVDVTVSCTRIWGEGEDKTSSAPLVIDRAAAASYIAALKTLRDEFGLYDDISVMKVAENRDIFTVEGAGDETDPETEWAYIRPVLADALEAFCAERAREGENLRADICGKLRGIGVLVDRVAELSDANTAALHERITARLTSLLADVGAAPDERLVLTECAALADRLAIDEELVRLRSHLSALEGMTAQDAPVGRRFDFQLQEVNREINTICSKCQNAEIAALGVELKNETEKVREQIQNIE